MSANFGAKRLVLPMPKSALPPYNLGRAINQLLRAKRVPTTLVLNSLAFRYNSSVWFSVLALPDSR
jgi:hypothetical protein